MQAYTIKVGDQSFQIRSDADEDHVNNLAREVTERYRAIDKKGPRASQEFRAMAMVAIVLLEELYSTSKSRDNLRKQSREFAQKMIARIDAILEDGTS
jgi:cell division protein ZapA (FtsZ GTPase activity inhibitor)